MSKREALNLRQTFETNDARRAEQQGHDDSGLRVHRDIAYIDDGDRCHRFDIFAPQECPKDTPVMINIHGGCLISAYKEVNENFNAAFARLGWQVVSLSYPRIPDTTLWHQIDDLMKALRFVKAHAEEYHLDLSHCVITGDSAGALLWLFLLSISQQPFLQRVFGIEGCDIPVSAGAFVSIMLDTQRMDFISVINDLILGDEDLRQPYTDYLLNPSKLVKVAELPPLFLVTSEEDVIREETRRLAKMLETDDMKYELHDIPKGKKRELLHAFCVMYPMYEESRTVLRQMDQFLRASFQESEQAEGVRKGREKQPEKLRGVGPGVTLRGLLEIENCRRTGMVEKRPKDCNGKPHQTCRLGGTVTYYSEWTDPEGVTFSVYKCDRCGGTDRYYKAY